jgi:hypothetical protein
VTDVTHLKELMKKIAADRASDESLTKKQRDLWTKYEEIFSSPIVAELDAILIDPQYEDARDRLLGKIFEVVSACFIVARAEEDRLKTAKATDAKKAVTKVVVEEAEKVWRKYPSFKRWRVAGLIEKPVNGRLIAKGRPVLSRRAINACLTRYQQHKRTIV